MSAVAFFPDLAGRILTLQARGFPANRLIGRRSSAKNTQERLNYFPDGRTETSPLPLAAGSGEHLAPGRIGSDDPSHLPESKLMRYGQAELRYELTGVTRYHRGAQDPVRSPKEMSCW